MNSVLSEANSACSAAQHPPASPRSALEDGNYNAERGYAGSQSRVDPVDCPAHVAFQANVANGKITFDGDQVGPRRLTLRPMDGICEGYRLQARL